MGTFVFQLTSGNDTVHHFYGMITWDNWYVYKYMYIIGWGTKSFHLKMVGYENFFIIEDGV